MCRLALCLFLCLPSFVPAQQPNRLSLPRQQNYSNSTPSSVVQVVYVINGSTLTTYNIDPQTLQAAQVGTLTLPQSWAPSIVMSPDGHFLYYKADQSINQQVATLYVYATSASGAPQAPPVQQVNAETLYSGPVFDSNAPFAYAVISTGLIGPQYTPYFLERFSFDAATGVLSRPQNEATYELPSEGGGDQTCELLLPSMNPAGSELYDEISCDNHEGTSATFNERAIDSQTGTLGPDAHIYTAGAEFGEGSYNVQIANNLIFNFEQGYQYPPTENVANVYQAQPNAATLISCGNSMLAACGDFEEGLAYPSGQYVFMTDVNNATTIGRVETSTGQIVADSASIPYQVQQFSPDGSIVYAGNPVGNALEIEIYGFNVSTGAVTQGGSISVPLDYDSWWAVERY
jgi:hypothetical protein